jgi:hypothetical protein
MLQSVLADTHHGMCSAGDAMGSCSVAAAGGKSMCPQDVVGSSSVAAADRTRCAGDAIGSRSVGAAGQTFFACTSMSPSRSTLCIHAG